MRKTRTDASRRQALMALVTLLNPQTVDKATGKREHVDPYSWPEREVAAWLRTGNKTVTTFVESFRGNTDSPFVEAEGALAALDPDELQTLLIDLDLLLRAGFEPTDQKYGGRTMPMESLRFGVRSAGRTRPTKLRDMGKKDRRALEAEGAYVLQVSGTTHDVVLYLVMTLLTAEGVPGRITRCSAPARNNPTETCGNWMVVGLKSGRLRESCSTACRQRKYDRSLVEESPVKKNRRAK